MLFCAKKENTGKLIARTNKGKIMMHQIYHGYANK